MTENVADFSAERDVALVFVLKPNLPVGSAQAPALAALLDRWAHDSPDPYLGPHWPVSTELLAGRALLTSGIMPGWHT